MRSRLLRLREHYVVAQDDHRKLTRLLVEPLPSFATLFRHALILAGSQPPATKHEIFQQASEQFSISPESFEVILGVRQGTKRFDTKDIQSLFDDYLAQITKTAEIVDRL